MGNGGRMNQTNQMNQMNQMNQTNQMNQKARLAGIAFFCGAIFGLLLAAGLSWLAWALNV